VLQAVAGGRLCRAAALELGTMYPADIMLLATLEAGPVA
jgi:hypothetical protein